MRRPWRAIGAWILFVVIALALGIATGTKQLENGAVGESARGYALMDEHGAWPPAREYGYIHSEQLTAAEGPFRAAVADVRRRMRKGLGSTPVVYVSPDRHAVLVAGVVRRFNSFGSFRTWVLAAGAANPKVTIEESGDITASDARDRVVTNDLHRAELFSIPVTLIILLFAFGAVVAALVPVLLALTAVVATFGLLGLISQAFPLDDSVKTVVLLIGMAVGVDYALFYVIRSREERHRGLSSHDALERTARTSGRTVLISGTTVAIAMAGMFVLGLDIFNGIASGTITVIACAVRRLRRRSCLRRSNCSALGSTSGRIPVRAAPGDRQSELPLLAGRRRPGATASTPLVLGRRRIARRACTAGSATARGQAGRRSPCGTQRAGSCDAGQDPDDLPERGGHGDRRRRGAPRLGAEGEGCYEELERLALAREIAHRPFTVSGSDHLGGSIEFPLSGERDNAASKRAISTLRNELVPQTFGRIPGVETAVTGTTAEDVDFTHQMKHGIPFVIVFVLALAFLLLLVAFRSVVVPLKAIALNLLSVGAAYGVLVLVFQHQWAEPILGFTSNGSIISWLPLFLFVVLFGLSMDYHVFILSRVREGVDSGMSTDEAVRHGITVTAGVVTSAALVMVGVFSLFGSLSSLELKQAGVGLATAVLIDATIVRAVLLPSTMKLLGERNWYLPRWLERIPRAPIEARSAREPS